MMKKYIFFCLMMFVSLNVFSQTDRQHIRKGNNLYRQQNYAKAEVEYRKAIEKNGSNPQALYNLGCALMSQQKDSAAIVQYENAGKLETNKLRKSKVYHNIGVICQKKQLYAEAINAYKESLRNNPYDDETRYNLELCKRQQKKQDKENKNKNNDKNKQDDKKDKNKQDKQNKEKENKDKNKEDNKKQQPKEQMSKDNAEQLLNAAIMQEKSTQDRLKKAMQQPRSRKLQKNW